MCGIVQTNVIHLTNSYVCPGLRCTQYSLEPTVTAEQLQSSPTTAQLSTHPARKGLGECRTVVNLGTKEQNSLTPRPDRCEKPP